MDIRSPKNTFYCCLQLKLLAHHITLIIYKYILRNFVYECMHVSDEMLDIQCSEILVRIVEIILYSVKVFLINHGDICD